MPEHLVFSRRKFLTLTATSAGVALLAACGQSAQTPAGSSNPASSNPAAPAAQPATTAQSQAPAASKNAGTQLRLHVRTGPEEDTLNAVLPKFSQDTGIQVKVESFPTTEYFTKLQTLIAGGTVGDVFWDTYRNTPRFANNKVIMPLDDLVAKDNFDLSQYFPSAIDSSRYQGVLYAMPFKLHPGPAALYYNVNALQEAGATMPDRQVPSWDQLVDIASKLTTQANGRIERYGLSLGLSTDQTTSTLQTLGMYARSWGGDLYSADGKTSLFNDQPMRDAVRFMADLLFSKKVAAPLQDMTSQAEDPMIAQRVAMLQASSSTKSITTKIGGKFDVRDVMMPPGPSGKVGTMAITDHINISASTKNPEAAWELVKLLVGHDVGVRLGGGTGGIASGTCGARIDVFNDPALMANPLHPIFIDLCQMATAPIQPANLREEEVATAVHQTIGPVFLGERQPDDGFFTQLNQAVQSVLDRPMA